MWSDTSVLVVGGALAAMLGLFGTPLVAMSLDAPDRRRSVGHTPSDGSAVYRTFVFEHPTSPDDFVPPISRDFLSDLDNSVMPSFGHRFHLDLNQGRMEDEPSLAILWAETPSLVHESEDPDIVANQYMTPAYSSDYDPVTIRPYLSRTSRTTVRNDIDPRLATYELATAAVTG